eukprot:1163318-Prymnesium_polylepis.1
MPSGRMQMVDIAVNATVEADCVAHRSTWGWVQAGASCSTPQRNSESLQLGKRSTLAFTACDTDGLPVDRILPRPEDNRTFQVSIERSSGVMLADNFDLEISYNGGGLYNAHFTMIRGLGMAQLLLILGSEIVPNVQQLNVTCPTGTVPLSDSLTCGCDAGYQANIDPGAENPCNPCPEGQHKPRPGHDRCEDCPPGAFAATLEDSKLPGCR